MGKYDLAYSGERLEYCSGIFERLADTYEKLMAQYDGDDPVAGTYALQLRELSRLLKEYAGLSSRSIMLAQDQEEDVENILLTCGVKVERMWLTQREDGSRELNLSMKSVGKKCPTTREIANLLAEALGNNWISSDNNRIMLNGIYNIYTFVEGGRFACVSGIARRNKDQNIVSGDGVSVEPFTEGKTMVALADGMGSGVSANEKSRLVIELMEDALCAGFTQKAIIEMINTTLSLNDNQGIPITLDLCVIDAVLGIANFVKLGAVATFIKRDGWVEIIQSETLPMGVLAKVDFDYTMKKLYAGDYVIMVSDGVLEELPCVNKEKALMDIVAGLESRNPTIMAEEIISKVLLWPKSIEEAPKDDMTALVIGLYER